jgi:putative membrane protein
VSEEPLVTESTGADPEALMKHGVISIETHFSWLRTRMSTERTLMSWVRTAIALIGFGFTIAQFLVKFNKATGVAPPVDPGLPRLFGLTLIAVGTLGLGFACVEYLLLVRYLRSDQFRQLRGIQGMPSYTPTLTVAVLLVIIGLITFVAVLLRTAG